jgi:hypothetical protein
VYLKERDQKHFILMYTDMKLSKILEEFRNSGKFTLPMIINRKIETWDIHRCGGQAEVHRFCQMLRSVKNL